MTRAGPGPKSHRLFARARRSLVGGVDSPVRAFRAVGGEPLFIARARGSHLWDVDGRRYLDLLGGWGANILGNAPPAVVRAVRATAGRGLGFGAPTELEHGLAERIRRAIPSMELLRFVNSGTEAVMSAVRVARGATGRTKVVMFEGGYHGHSDGLLAQAGSGIASQALPGSAGVPPGVVAETLLAPFNDVEAVAALLEAHSDSVAAVIVEPVAGNMGVIPPAAGVLPALERLCRRNGALLIADEVITGFRLRRGAYHTSLGVRADLVTLGKVIGGGLPVGAYGGRADLMEKVAPLGPVYQAGTLSGNPLVMAAGSAALDALTPKLYRRLDRVAGAIETGWLRAARDSGCHDLWLSRVGSMFGIFFGGGRPRDYREAQRVDRDRYARFFWGMLDEGVYLPPSPLETAFVSAAVTDADVADAIAAARQSLEGLGEGG